MIPPRHSPKQSRSASPDGTARIVQRVSTNQRTRTPSGLTSLIALLRPFNILSFSRATQRAGPQRLIGKWAMSHTGCRNQIAVGF